MSGLKKIITTIGVVVVLLIVALGYVILWTGSTKDIEAVANKFQPGGSWTLVSERIEPPRYICINGGTCPELTRSWNSSENIAQTELNNIITKAGWNFPIRGDCLIKDEMSGSVDLCTSKGRISNYNIYISYGSPDIANIKPKLSLLINKVVGN